MSGITRIAFLTLILALAMAQPAFAQRSGAAPPRPPMTGMWERSISFRAGGSFTEYGQSLKEGLTVFDDPEFYCEGYNVVRLTNTANTPVRMTEHSDRLEIEYEGNAALRIIYLDGKTPSDNTGVIGNSIGSRVRGGTIEITTDGFPDNLVHGVRATSAVTTNALKYMERYLVSQDGQTMQAFLMTVDDKSFEYPRVLMGTWKRLPDDTYFQPFPCEIHDDEEIYTEEFREKAEKMLEEQKQ